MPAIDWNRHYESGHPPWESSGHPSSELARVIAEENISPCRMFELGCGSGVNAVWLAQQGFDVTAVDFNELAISKARQRAAEAGVNVRFLQGDVLNFPTDLETEPGFQPFPLFFDRGCYHSVRNSGAAAYVRTLQRLTAPQALGLILTGNAKEPHVPGPPVVSEEQFHAELEPAFEILRLREFRFDEAPAAGPGFLAWSSLLRRRATY